MLALEASRAFDATRRFEDLIFYHVDFDALNADEQTESTLGRLVASQGRIAVVGPSGSGKSSVIASVLGPLATDLPESVLPLRIPVGADEEIAKDPGPFARHIVGHVTRWASKERLSVAEQQALESGAAEVIRRAGDKRTRKYHVGLPIWLANAEFGREVQSAGEEFERRASGADSVEYLKQMVALFHSHELSPVFVFDDSDAWLNVAELDRTDIANAFFLKTVRMMCKEVDAGLVLAVHTGYLELDGYKEATQWLSGEVSIPRLADPPQGVGKILTDRLAISEVEATLAEVIDTPGVAKLSEYYEADRTIRDLLRVVQRALQHALSDSHDRITSQLIEQAMAELGS